MRRFITIIPLMVFFLLSDCNSADKFPNSQVTPAADTTALRTKDKNGNYEIVFTVKNLAGPKRLTPPRKVYVVWIVTRGSDEVVNVGQLTVNNIEPAVLKTLTAFEPIEIFFTAEDKGGGRTPLGPEISRVKFTN